MLRLTKTGATFLYRPPVSGPQLPGLPGWAWLDYQQEGLTAISGMDKFLGALTPTPATSDAWHWMWLAIQQRGVQYAIRFVGSKAIQALTHGRTAEGQANVWVTGQPAQYAVRATATVLATYPGTTVPSRVRVTIHTAIPATLTLTSYVGTLPLFIMAGAFESPAFVDGSMDSRATIEWNVDMTTPEISAMKAGFEKPAAYQRSVTAPDPYAVTTLTGAVVLIAGLIAVIAAASVYIQKCRKLVPKKSVAAAPRAAAVASV
jgi:hypothetical protein